MMKKLITSLLPILALSIASCKKSDPVIETTLQTPTNDTLAKANNSKGYQIDYDNAKVI